jgi:hypothetical protein
MNAASEVDAIRLTQSDDVATVLRTVAAGERIRVRCGEATEAVVAIDPIPLCHKISMVGIEVGAPVRKFGETIGVATATIACGAHIHVHNMASRRAK